jgi:glyoxylase-like metal-dependent hydrolase (beta-lactamase superfamily II)
MIVIRRLLLSLAALFAFLPALAPAQDAPERAITRIAGDVYRFQNQFHYSAFLVTDDGIIATDPINPDAARWLKAELDARFAKPVRYLIYSHDHADHIAGGEIFADTATIITHENAYKHIVDEGRPAAIPDMTFSDRMTLSLGGKTVELVYLGRNHGDSSIVTLFRDDRVAFAVDFVAVDRLPYQDLPNSYLEDWLASLRRLEGLDFDILVPGHGGIGRRADVAPQRRYLEELRDAVLGHMRAGLDVEAIKPLVRMEAYSHWGSYERWLDLNIEGMVRHMHQYRRGN